MAKKKTAAKAKKSNPAKAAGPKKPTRLTPAKKIRQAKTSGVVHRKKGDADSSIKGYLKEGAEKIAETFGGIFSKKPSDIVAAIKADHDDLREFIDILKDAKKPIAVRKNAYKQFAVLLKSHSSSEEKAVYAPLFAFSGQEMHIKVAEGYVEHGIADELLRKIDRCKDPIEWSAHANVLAEMVEHHVEEEESDLLPKIRRIATVQQNDDMLEKFIKLRARSQKTKNKNNAGVLEDEQLTLSSAD